MITARVRTDGATLHTESRGTGPALLMISGGGGDAVYYGEVAELLADTYTVLTYDRRGNSRSTVDDPTAPLRMQQQTADALAVLAHHDVASALVFGGSGGALIALDLTARHPEVVEGVIAHEPPVLSLFPDTDRALFDEIDEIRRLEGPAAAYVRFISSIDRPESPAMARNRTGRRVLAGLVHAGHRVFRIGPRSLREVGRLLGNAEYLMEREVRPFLEFEPDYAAVTGSGIPTLVGVGADSRTYYPGRSGEAVAARLGVPVVEFPGPHAGYLEKPAEFAATLRAVLADLRQPAR